jgi:hypothetical protein
MIFIKLNFVFYSIKMNTIDFRHKFDFKIISINNEIFYYSKDLLIENDIGYFADYEFANMPFKGKYINVMLNYISFNKLITVFKHPKDIYKCIQMFNLYAI